MSTTATQMRAWQGPALLSFGFRPFFLAGALHAAVMIGLWLPRFYGEAEIGGPLPPVAWHAHELLFGYVPAVIAGFLLTAVPNWTGRLPVVGLPLAVLFSLWLLGRVVVASSFPMSPLWVAMTTLAFLPALAAVIAREIVAGRNWRNLKVLAAVSALGAAQVGFHYEVWQFGHSTYAVRIAIAVILMLIMIIGGRIVPSFTINWLRQHNPGSLPQSFSAFDKLAMVVAGGALATWILLPAVPAVRSVAGLLLLTTCVLHGARQLRWTPFRTWRQPLVTVLHAAYGFVTLGFALAGAAAWSAEPGLNAAAVHAWTVGGIGLMTLAVMTRATLGHTGRSLTADVPTVGIFLGIVLAALSRIAGAVVPEIGFVAIHVAATAWVVSFLTFVIAYGPMLVLPRRPSRS